MRGLRRAALYYSRSAMQRIKTILARTPALAFGASPPVRFIVLSRSRSGTNLLLEMLNAHRNVLAFGEVFQQLNGRAASEVLEEIRRPTAFFIKALGFKIFYYHPLDRPAPELWDALSADFSLRIIHLRRHNRLETKLSHALATRSNRWAQRVGEKPSGPLAKVYLDPDEMRREFESMAAQEAECSKRFENHRVFDLRYEDLFVDGPRQFGRVCRFLDVPAPRPTPPPGLVKQTRSTPDQIIGNFEALREHFLGTPWADYFEPANFSHNILKDRLAREA